MIKVFDMFAGYGGAEFALKKAGIEHECIGFSEIDKYAIQCFKQNHGDIKNYGDCTKINTDELPDFDLLCGGFPCQSFSVAGKGLGELDPRGTLFYEIVRIAEIKQPKYMLLENVKGLTFKTHKATFDKILSELDRIGYRIHWKVLNTKYFGIPQNRERVFFVCIRKDLEQEFEFPQPIIEENVKYDTDMSVPYIGQANRIYGTDGVIPPLNVGWTPLIKVKTTHIKYTLKDILLDEVEQKYYLTDSQLNTLQRKFGSKGKLLDIEKEADTITSSMGTGGGNVPYITNAVLLNPFNGKNSTEESGTIGTSVGSTTGKTAQIVIDPKKYSGETNSFRKLTPKECFRLMGFVNDEINLEGLSDTQKYKLAGNGWCIQTVSKIFTEMFKNTEYMNR